MKNPIKKTSHASSLEEFLMEKTGVGFQELTKWTGKSFERFSEVKAILEEAVKNSRPIYLVGDYDSDGINSVNIMTLLFMTMKAKFYLMIPKRESEGYGLSQKIIDRIPDNVVLVTIDNGISAVEQMKEAKRRGMTTIILDHHTSGETIPEVDVLIDPSAIGEADYTHYCGAGIAYRLAEYILGEQHPIIKHMSVFAAIATIGDVVKLTGDNRQIVIEGMKNAKLGFGTNAVQALFEQAKFGENSTSTDIAFNIVPVLNAPERLEDGGASKVCQVLLKSSGYAEGVNWLMEQNQRRKDIVKQVMSTIDLDSYRNSSEKVIFLKSKSIPVGIAGIIAGKLSEGTGKPAFVFGYNNDILKGSARSKLQNISIIEMIRKNEKLLISCGGHPGAAGLAVTEENYDAFKTAMESVISEEIHRKELEGIKQEFELEEYSKYDIEANDFTFTGMANSILALEPVGEGVPAPKLRIKSRLVKVQPFGGSKDCPDNQKPHIRFTFSNFVAIGFNMNEWYEKEKERVSYPRFVDIIGTVMENNYNGNKTIQVKMEDFELL